MRISGPRSLRQGAWQRAQPGIAWRNGSLRTFWNFHRDPRLPRYPGVMPELPESEIRCPGRTAFTSTHWSVVLAAAQSGAPDDVSALEKLCRTYWYPLYAYVRRGGYSAHDAQD